MHLRFLYRYSMTEYMVDAFVQCVKKKLNVDKTWKQQQFVTVKSNEETDVAFWNIPVVPWRKEGFLQCRLYKL